MLKDIVDLLDGHLFPGVVVNGRADDTVTALANDLLDGVPGGGSKSEEQQCGVKSAC